MKNFNKPEDISPTLEIDEVRRLYESIKQVASIEEADTIIEKIPLVMNSTPEERAQWVENLSEVLEKSLMKVLLSRFVRDVTVMKMGNWKNQRMH